MLYFFLSYARGDDDEYVERFYKDLCVEVRVLTGIRRDVEVGFLDNHSIDLGQRWQDALVRALSSCRAFLALCSPAYFLSEPCGKEWAIFSDRVQRWERNHSDDASALIPLAWVAPRQMREPAQTLQYTSDTLGEAYTKGGLRQLLRLQRNRDEYLEFVSALAERIVRAAENDLPQLNPMPRFANVRSIFHTGPRLVSSGSEAVSTINGTPVLAGSEQVYFVIVAPSASQAATVRSDLRYYGDHPEDWAPYRPELDQSLGEHAARVAAGRRLESAVASIEQLTECLDQAKRQNQIVVLLVDAWSTNLDPHQSILQQYDHRNEPTTAVLVPWSHTDAETQDNGAVLSESLRRTLVNSSSRVDVLYRPRVLTHEAFGADLSVVLEVARNRVFARGTPYRRPFGTAMGNRPILEGPWQP